MRSCSRNERADAYAASINAAVWVKSSGDTSLGAGPGRYTTGMPVAITGASSADCARIVTIAV